MDLRVETTRASKNHSSPIPPTKKPLYVGVLCFQATPT